ncbi:RRM domain containing protein [Cryptosporidium sp. chipmunk genotype I]|uniref:RRM domain containing protein n=1 Tax=Cryptosporidium sp. chipmunk genotype I TaxID=1280935 RepID=UPI00351A3A68|nr:RRM domain containing protein [Cryptosporidium sp. chipmunk genotype I]
MTGEIIYNYKRSKSPSELIHISNLGRKCYFGLEEDLVKEFQTFGEVKEFHLGENSNSFVLFANLRASIQFYEHCMQLHAEEAPVLIGGRRIKADYSERVEVKSRVKNQVDEDYNENRRFLAEKGLVLVEDFITELEAVELLDWIDSNGQWETKLNRKVQHYGYSFDYNNKTISSVWERDIPCILTRLVERMLLSKLITEVPNQITINEYELGKGIGPHIDSHHTIGENISVISLGSGILFEFNELKKCQNPDFSSGESSGVRRYDRIGKKTVYIPENSLYIMQNEIRYAWEHGIRSRKYDKIQGKYYQRKRRVSITFRKYKESHYNYPCECDYKDFCDSRDSSIRILPERI